MRVHSASLVEETLVVSQELIRVSILWTEMWHGGLEEASREYFGEKSIEGFFAVLEPLHTIMEKGPETLQEISFYQAFGASLQEALEWCRKYKRTGNVADLDQAWDLYYLVFKATLKQLPQLTALDLSYVSPKLVEAKNLEVAVPGTYRSGEPVVRIAGFERILNVITSKQRPRKFTMTGSDGKEYQYLLKGMCRGSNCVGHEDLRQDERVMQLFGLVNTLLKTDSETFKRHLNIVQYPVIPLSHISGLIGWVPHCDTLHSLICDYRESRKITINAEQRLIFQMAPDYENKLCVAQKVEVFERTMEATDGMDLYRVLWLGSKTSEVWLDRRTAYTRSLALMSMVGYILGLGDRHLSNLMLERLTGRVIHIDFGDCFEVAMTREKFPERIPFRLTRMLVNAMGGSGIEGNYRRSGEEVMRVLRGSMGSLMAVLEAFVHDPLVNWWRVGGKGEEGDVEGSGIVGGSGSELNLGDKGNSHSNPRAVAVITRVSNKLTGRDFKRDEVLGVEEQVEKLIVQARSVENLCQCYAGWCSFW